MARIRRLCYAAGVWTTSDRGVSFAPSRFTRLNAGLLEVPAGIDLVCPSADETDRERVEPCQESLDTRGIDTKALLMQGGRFSRYIRHFMILWSLVARADAVCLDMPQIHSVLAGLACRLRGAPYFVRLLGDWPGAIMASGPVTWNRRGKAWLAECATHFLVRNAGLVFCQGKALSAKYARFNRGAMKGELVHTTLSAEVFFERKRAPLHRPVRVISVAGLVPFKGLEFLARAIALLRDRGVRTEWWCVGKGPEHAKLENLSRDLQISSQVVFHGYVPLGPDLFRLYREADLFILPSKGGEGVPLAMLEAMASSLPVVASSVGGIPGMIADGVDGILVRPENPKEIADAVNRLVDDPMLSNRMSRAAFEKAGRYSAACVWETQRALIEATFGKFENESYDSNAWTARTDQHSCAVSHSDNA
jgi:glycosyltransferase involved in cell wall biosynthesis